MQHAAQPKDLDEQKNNNLLLLRQNTDQLGCFSYSKWKKLLLIRTISPDACWPTSLGLLVET